MELSFSLCFFKNLEILHNFSHSTYTATDFPKALLWKCRKDNKSMFSKDPRD